MGIAYKGASDFTYNLNVKAGKPLDSRLVVQFKTDLSLESYKNTFTIDGVNAYYPGMVVSCQEDGKLYILKSESEGFVEVGKETPIPIKSISLNGTKQTPDNTGDVNLKLNDIYYTTTLVDKKIEDLGTVFRYKGSVTSYDDLLDSTKVPNPVAGDVYNVREQSQVDSVIYPAGTNFVYTSSSTWDSLGGVSALDELKTLSGSGANNSIVDGDILTATVSNGTTTFSWKKAPTTTTITGSTTTVSDTISTPEHYTISGKNDKDESTSGIVYSKAAIDNWLSWNDITDNTTEPTE